MSHATAPDRSAGGPAEPNAVFAEFFRNVAVDIDHMMARRVGAASGFSGRDTPPAGSHWEREVLDAVGTCQVLVALVSRPFAGSEWCGKEWDAFTRRRTWRRSDGALMEGPQCVLPVLWTASQGDYPAAVMRQQRFRPRPTSRQELDQLYLREGLYGMYRTEHDAYRATVWRIAQEIINLVGQYWVEPLVVGDSKDLVNAFVEDEEKTRREHAATGPAPYFFLSYAASLPLAMADPEPADHVVSSVYEDLSVAVRQAARLDPQQPVGFVDGLVQLGENWESRVTRELGTANVFVPLYSPRYFAMNAPGREWASFTARLADNSAENLRAHMVPVLWAPMFGAAGPPGLPDPLDVVGDVPEYAENGLRALKMLSYYSEQYERVIARLAEAIIAAARDRPLDRSPAPALDRIASAFHRGGDEDDFVIAVAAPTRSSVPVGRNTAWYGYSSTDWHPFDESGALRLAEHALAVAERLSFNTAVLSVQEAAREPFAIPGVVLIDPWIAAPPEGDNDALHALRTLYNRPEPRQCALPILVLNGDDPESTADQDILMRRITRVLKEVGAPSAESSRSDNVVTSFADFARAIPSLVAEAERRYLRYESHPDPA